MIKKDETWFLVMDSKNASIYTKNKSDYSLLTTLEFTPRKTHRNDNTRNSLPRSFESSGTIKHIIEPHTDEHTKEQMEFIDSVNELLKSKLQDSHCKAMVLIAPPKMLGLLRKNLDKHIKEIIKHEINKEITNLDEVQIKSILKEIHI